MAFEAMSQPIIKPGLVCIVLQGRHAGKKAVIVEALPHSEKGSYAIVAGIAALPRRITNSMSDEEAVRRGTVRSFVKCMNVNHLMPTSCRLENNYKDFISTQTVADVTKRREIIETINKDFQKRILEHKDTWFFTKLPINA